MFRSVRLLSSPGIRKLHGNTQNAPKSRLVTITFALFSVATAYTVGSLYPIQPLALLFPAPAPPPLDASSPAGVEYMASLETSLLSLPFLTRLQSAPDKDQWYLTRPHASLPEDRRANHLTAGALRGPGRLATPVVWAKRDESEAFVILHLGRGLCGHDGIVHGGLLATLLDEVMARTAIMNFPERIGVTATLDVSYRAPTKADQFIVIHTKLDEVKGRKAFVSATAETLDGIRLVDATSMFVQPKYASLLNKTLVAQTLGASPQQSITSAPSASGEVPVHLADGNITKTSK
ncbi:HotDog domain-containing protein, partial [Rhodocollybia butyracea]